MVPLTPPLLSYLNITDDKSKRRWMLKYHPDLNKDVGAAEKFKLVSECYTAWKECRQPRIEYKSALLQYIGIHSGRDYHQWKKKEHPPDKHIQLVTKEFDIVYGAKEREISPYKKCGTLVDGIVHCRHIATASGKCIYHENPEFLKHVKKNHRVFFSRTAPRHCENACLFISKEGICPRKKSKGGKHCVYHEFKLKHS